MPACFRRYLVGKTLRNKAYLSAITVTNISQSFTYKTFKDIENGAQKWAGQR